MSSGFRENKGLSGGGGGGAGGFENPGGISQSRERAKPPLGRCYFAFALSARRRK